MARLASWAFPAGVAALVAFGAAAGTRQDGEARVELELAGVLPIADGSAAILVLREKGARTLLPLVVPGSSLGAHGAELRGPGLLGQAIDALGGRVAEVEIDRAEESRAGARVRLSQGTRSMELRGRPSESVALAVSARVPIVTRRRILDQSGLTPEDLAKAKRAAQSEADRL